MEHNILLVKPVPIDQEQITEAIRADLMKSGFEVVAVNSKPLSTAEFEKHFICKSLAHSEYMTSGPVTSILYKGESATSFGRAYKGWFRKQHPTDELRNILHSTEPGNEFATQFKLFFPDLNIAHHHQVADQGVYFGKLDEAQRSELSALSAFNLIAANEEEANSQQFKSTCELANCQYIGVRESAHAGTEILRYRRKHEQGAPDAKELRVVLFKEEQNFWAAIPQLKETHKVHAVVCYKPNFTLLQTEELRTATFENNLFCIGGSFGDEEPGSIRVSQELIELFDNWFECGQLVSDFPVLPT
ncbi:hypothetical protein GCM10007094_37520 [Pseudovibrio japonicus]|uniref:Nucleoside diphosphate kinase-like domain-containing protein n=1 Tax=Pseudovibrio japonicus TaxID=366534 RepID=A0ABQ3EMZ3_9HYPH|nr:nucleoside-diphosphate kinase [Pseudovibrio japonicus]GHB44679.1 hypothetical protein GCM10007094_37520 [Pseudovibrio japonicus]